MCAGSALLLSTVLLSLAPMCCVGDVSATASPASPKQYDNLWDAISGDPGFSNLTACLEMADPSVVDLLKASSSSAATAQPLTLFAPTDLAFEQPAWGRSNCGRGGRICKEGANDNGSIFGERCKDEQSATALVSYHVSTMASATPYIGEEFPTLLGNDFSPLYYGIPKAPDVPAEFFPIQFVDSANVTSTPTAVGGRQAAVGASREGGEGPSYLYPVDRVLRPPVGTIWKTLCSDPSFSLLAAALNSTSLAATLDGDGGGAGAVGYTLFAPDDDAIRASPGFPQDDPEVLEVLLSFHTLATGIYPLSLSGVHFSQQLYKVDPTSGSLSRDYYQEFYTDAFQDGQFTSMAGPILNVSRASSSSPPSSSSCQASSPQQQHPQQQQPIQLRPLPSLLSARAPSLLIEGVPISEADITATNGVIHRLSSAVMAPPDTVAGVLLNPPFPLSAAGELQRERAGLGSRGEGGGFEALGELVHLAWSLVKATLTEEGPLTFLAPTDAAFDLAIAAGDLPPRPWYKHTKHTKHQEKPPSSPPSPPSSLDPSLSPERAARVLLSHTLRSIEGEGPLLFTPTAGDPFASGFKDGDRVLTAAVAAVAAAAAAGSSVSSASDGGDRSGGDDDGGRGAQRRVIEASAGGMGVEVGVRVFETGTRSAVAGTADGVADREVYVDGARVIQCVDGTGVGHDCGSKPRPSNTYALNGDHLCVVHAVDRVMFPADPSTDLAAILDGTPSLSRFASLLRENGLLSSSSSHSLPASGAGPTMSTAIGSEEATGGGRGGGSRGENSERGRKQEGRESSFTTVFAPTNGALARLERERPWLFRNSTAAAEGDDGEEGDGGSVVEGKGGGRVGDGGGWSPVRELLAYHLAPGQALFSRYFNASSPPTRTLALNGTAPVAASFIMTAAASLTGANARLSSPAAAVAAAGPGGAGERGVAGTGSGTLHVNLQTCSSTDRPASDGVLHVLAFVDDDDNDAKDEGENSGDNENIYKNLYDGDGGTAGDAAGVLVPDVLELTYAYGFRETYEAIVTTDAAAAEADGTADNKATVADALRGRAAHTLLAVASANVNGYPPRPQSRTAQGSSSSPSFYSSGLFMESGVEVSADTLRYQTLTGDQAFGSLPSSSRRSSSVSPFAVSIGLETLLGVDAHLFNNSENPGNPFYSPATALNGSGLNIDHAEVLSNDGGMVALNGRIHQISEPLRVPAPDVFSLLSSHQQLAGWTNWVQQAGLAEFLSDPTAGPFTVFAPVDASLKLVPGLMAIAADTESLMKLVRFHIALGTAATTSAKATALAASRLFTPSLANATAEERSALSGDRFVSGPRLWTLLDHGDDDLVGNLGGPASARMLSVQIASAGAATGDDVGGRSVARLGSSGGNSTRCGIGLRVFVGPGGDGQQRQNGGGSDMFLGAFAAEVVLPNLNAVNGVVHGISGVMTYPGYVRPKSLYKK